MTEKGTCPMCMGKGTVSVGLGGRVKILRQAKNLKQLELANKVVIPRPRLGNIESGHRSATPEEIVRLARFFGVSSDELLGLEMTGKGGKK